MCGTYQSALSRSYVDRKTLEATSIAYESFHSQGRLKHVNVKAQSQSCIEELIETLHMQMLKELPSDPLLAALACYSEAHWRIVIYRNVLHLTYAQLNWQLRLSTCLKPHRASLLRALEDVCRISFKPTYSLLLLYFSSRSAKMLYLQPS